MSALLLVLALSHRRSGIVNTAFSGHNDNVTEDIQVELYKVIVQKSKKSHFSAKLQGELHMGVSWNGGFSPQIIHFI